MLSLSTTRAGVAWLVPLAAVGGMLDATAIANVGSFGLGIFLATGGLAGAFLLLSLALDPHTRIAVPRLLVAATLTTLAVIWLATTVQLATGVGRIEVMLTQCMLRTLLIGNFAVCVLLFRLPGAPRILEQAVLVLLAVFLLYGLYDLIAQVFGLPRFLNALRNNSSLGISQYQGAQGWIQLPRLSSLAAEPSHTVMHLALAFAIATRLRGKLRWILLLLALAFAVGTFARTVWLVLVGAGAAAFGIWLLETLRDELPRASVNIALGAAAVALPFAAAAVPLLTTLPPDADLSLSERLDSSRTALRFFFDYPLTGVGFQGWAGQFYQFTPELAGTFESLFFIHNGVAAYLGALGIVGAIVIYFPVVLILWADNLSNPAKGWWLTVFTLFNLGGDYFAFASTWTTLAIILSLQPKREGRA